MFSPFKLADLKDESQVSVGPLNQQVSLDEAYIILGIEGGAQQDDTAVMVAYNELVFPQTMTLSVDWRTT